MQTPATIALDRAGVSYSVTEYELPADAAEYGAAVVEALSLDADTVGKTLVATLDADRHVLAVVPVTGTLDLKALARAAGAKRAAMADPAVAERLTGAVVGGIAPLGSRRRLDVFLDEGLLAADVVHVSAGRRGAELTLSPTDLVAASSATVAAIAVRETT